MYFLCFLIIFTSDWAFIFFFFQDSDFSTRDDLGEAEDIGNAWSAFGSHRGGQDIDRASYRRQ